MTTWSIGLLGMLAFGLVATWAAMNFNGELKKSHLVLWRDLGTPSLFSPSTTRHQLRWTSFILFRKYRHLGNQRLSFFGNVILASIMINAVLLMLMISAVPEHHRPAPGFWF